MPVKYDYGKAAPTSPMDRMGSMFANTAPSQTPARAVGRSMKSSPERRFERAARRGSLSAARVLLDSKQQQEGRDFALQRDDKMYERSKEMRGIDQAFTEKLREGDRAWEGEQKAQSRADALEAERRKNERDDYDWSRRREADKADRAAKSVESAFYISDPTGEYRVPVTKDAEGNTAVAYGAQKTPVPVKQPTPEEIAKHTSDMLGRKDPIRASWDGSKWQYEPLRPQKPETGSTTTTFDAEGNVVQKQERKPTGGSSNGGGGYF